MYQNNKILSLTYTAKEKWGQILFIHANDLTKFENIFFNYDNRKLLIYECLNQLLDKNLLITTFTPRKAKFCEINYVDDLQTAKLIRD
jgi:uncharacterized protein YdeI (YjbR/CyaY-like superfamily)